MNEIAVFEHYGKYAAMYKNAAGEWTNEIRVSEKAIERVIAEHHAFFVRPFWGSGIGFALVFDDRFASNFVWNILYETDADQFGREEKI